MAKAVIFPSEETLLAAINARLVPTHVASEPVRFFRRDDGALGVCPHKALPKSVTGELARVGAELGEPNDDDELHDRVCWPAILPSRRAAREPSAQRVLFVADGQDALLALLGELVRLGCGPCSFMVVDSFALVLASDPPYYSVALAGEPGARYRVFVASPPDQDRVWTELGFEHPLAARATPPSGMLSLIRAREDWDLVPAKPWRDVFDLVDLEIAGPITEHRTREPEGRLPIALRLAKAERTRSPGFWLFERDAIDAIAQLVSTLPDHVVGRLLFAVIEGPTPRVLLRARPSRSGPPAITPAARELIEVPHIDNLYAPAGRRIEPPLGRERLRELLAPDPDNVYWLTEDASGVRVDSVADRAFCPLTDWIEYVIDREGEQLEAWARSARFEMPPFSEPPPPPDAEPPRQRWRGYWARYRPKSQPLEPEPTPVLPELEAATVIEPDVAQSELAELERSFLERTDPLDSDERSEQWLAMAVRHVGLGNAREAGICFGRALWEPGADIQRRSRVWARAMTAPAELGDAPALADVIGVAASCIAGHSSDNALVAWLDRFDGDLDARTIWLCRSALSNAAGGDRLGMVRTRDRLLRRLKRGLSLERDVPRFLRFAGSDGADSVAATQLAAELEALVERYRSTRRNRSRQEAPESKTLALVRLELAFAFATLGRTERANELRGLAIGQPPRDPVDRFLAAAYSARIDQALEGAPRGAALPAEVSALLNQLDTFERYKVDRLRAASNVLEPHERLDPMLAFRRGVTDPRGDEFVPLRGMESRTELAEALSTLLDTATHASTNDDERARLLDGVFDLLLELPDASALALLERAVTGCAAVEPERRVFLLEEALEVAGFFGKEERARAIADQIGELLLELGPEQGIAVAADLSACLRSLRRVGLKGRGVELLQRLRALSRGDGLDAIEARVHVAAGLSYFGDVGAAENELAATTNLLEDPAMPGADRLRLIRALAVAWSQTPRERAIAGLRQLSGLLPSITDSFNTNSHFCLSVVSFIDAIALGLATRDLALGEVARRFLDEDEYLVRRRIHRDLEEM